MDATKLIRGSANIAVENSGSLCAITGSHGTNCLSLK